MHNVFKLNYLALRLSESQTSTTTVSRLFTTSTRTPTAHQISAALFALNSLRCGGCVLADEVGLGKTIEAALVISQLWFEGRRRILVVAPVMLVGQWFDELSEHFGLPVRVVTSGLCSQFRQQPEQLVELFFPKTPAVVVTNYHCVDQKGLQLDFSHYDLVVLDEAHVVRNLEVPPTRPADEGEGTKTSRAARLLQATHGVPKLLLTATPLQNRWQDYRNLLQFIQPHFKTIDSDKDLAGLTEYLVVRNLRSDLQARGQLDITQRRLLPIFFNQSATVQHDEFQDRLLGFISDFYECEGRGLSRNGVFMPLLNLLELAFSRIWGSSNQALLSVFNKLRLEIIAALDTANSKRVREAKEVSSVYEPNETLDDDALAACMSTFEVEPDRRKPLQHWSVQSLQQLQSRLDLLIQQLGLFEVNPKIKQLVNALPKLLQDLKHKQMPEKAIVFVSFKQTQQEVYQQLLLAGFSVDELVLISGDNTSERVAEIVELYRQSLGLDTLPLHDQNKRKALLWYFREHGKILIATDAANEGLNLQFCNVLINYDLPWNPQVVEQRIGRIHRIGQKHEVYIYHLFNLQYGADAHIAKRLAEKISVFKRFFQSSDEILSHTEFQIPALDASLEPEQQLLQHEILSMSVADLCMGTTSVDWSKKSQSIAAMVLDVHRAPDLWPDVSNAELLYSGQLGYRKYQQQFATQHEQVYGIHPATTHLLRADNIADVQKDKNSLLMSHQINELVQGSSRSFVPFYGQGRVDSQVLSLVPESWQASLNSGFTLEVYQLRSRGEPSGSISAVLGYCGDGRILPHEIAEQLFLATELLQESDPSDKKTAACSGISDELRAELVRADHVSQWLSELSILAIYDQKRNEVIQHHCKTAYKKALKRLELKRQHLIRFVKNAAKNSEQLMASLDAIQQEHAELASEFAAYLKNTSLRERSLSECQTTEFDVFVVGRVVCGRVR
jgi:ERCC4-related helicase